MNTVIINSVAILTAILLLIFAFFAFSYKKGRTVSYKILSAFLFSNALYIIDFSLNSIEQVLGMNLHWFRGFGSSFGFLFGPLLYLFSKSITQKNFRIRWLHLVHFIVFGLDFLRILLNAEISFIFVYGAFHLQTIPYMIACLVVIINYRMDIKNYYSSVSKLNLTWMLYVVGAFFIMWMVDLFTFLFIELNILNPDYESYFTFLSLLINFVFAVLIFYKALQYPGFFTNVSDTDRPHKYEQSRLTKEEKKQYLHNLEQHFEKDKPFLNPDLTISDVAAKLKIPTKYLSQVINESLQKNFYDLINSYRVEEAKKTLTKEDTSKTVLEILYNSGFNSKSAFNTAFKKHTGYTPSQYRKQADNS